MSNLQRPIDTRLPRLPLSDFNRQISFTFDSLFSREVKPMTRIPLKQLEDQLETAKRMRRNRVVTDEEIEYIESTKQRLIKHVSRAHLELTGKELPESNIGVEVLGLEECHVTLLGVDDPVIAWKLRKEINKKRGYDIHFRAAGCKPWSDDTQGDLGKNPKTGELEFTWRCKSCGNTQSKKTEIDKGHEVHHKRICMNEQCRKVYRTIVPKGAPVKMPVGAYDVSKQERSSDEKPKKMKHGDHIKKRLEVRNHINESIDKLKRKLEKHEQKSKFPPISEHSTSLPKLGSHWLFEDGTVRTVNQHDGSPCSSNRSFVWHDGSIMLNWDEYGSKLKQVSWKPENGMRITRRDGSNRYTYTIGSYKLLNSNVVRWELTPSCNNKTTIALDTEILIANYNQYKDDLTQETPSADFNLEIGEYCIYTGSCTLNGKPLFGKLCSLQQPLHDYQLHAVDDDTVILFTEGLNHIKTQVIPSPGSHKRWIGKETGYAWFVKNISRRREHYDSHIEHYIELYGHPGLDIKSLAEYFRPARPEEGKPNKVRVEQVWRCWDREPVTIERILKDGFVRSSNGDKIPTNAILSNGYWTFVSEGDNNEDN